jgi:hypothetical protein
MYRKLLCNGVFTHTVIPRRATAKAGRHFRMVGRQLQRKVRHCCKVGVDFFPKLCLGVTVTVFGGASAGGV